MATKAKPAVPQKDAMGKKYEITSKTFVICAPDPNRKITLYQIKALRDIPEHNIYRGKHGGYIESEKNLSQDGAAWINERCCVFGNAVVKDNAYLILIGGYRGELTVGEDAVIEGNARIVVMEHHNTSILGNTKIGEDAVIGSNVTTTKNRERVSYGRIEIAGKTRIENATLIQPYGSGDVLRISDNVVIGGKYLKSEIKGTCKISGNAKIGESVYMDDSDIGEDAEIRGGSYDRVKISGNVKIDLNGGGTTEFLRTKISGNVVIKGNGIKIENSSIEDNVQIGSSVHIKGSKIYGHAKLSGVIHNWLQITDSKIGGYNFIENITLTLNQCNLKNDFMTDREDKIHYYLSLFDRVPSGKKDTYQFYIPVRKIDKGIFITVDTHLRIPQKIHLASHYVFRESETTSVYADVDPTTLSDKIRVTTPFYALNASQTITGLTFIEVEVNMDDIYQVNGNEAYVNKVRTIREVKI